jgi:formiminoglutamase
MNIIDYFHPVELEQPVVSSNLGNASFNKKIYVHTANNPIHNLNNIDLVILGIQEDRNSAVPGAAQAPGPIREKLYQLAAVQKINIVDLGDFKNGQSINDTYAGLSDMLDYLLRQGTKILVLGGSNDLVYSLVKNAYFKNKKIELTTIDARLNFEAEAENMDDANYLSFVLQPDNADNILYNNIGSQAYLNDMATIAKLENQLSGIYRLGEVKRSLHLYEPVMRNSDVVAIDICSVKQSEAQGQYNPSPNGFESDEVCQLAWYTGLSDVNRVFGIFDVCPGRDFNGQTAGLAAQMAWHYIFGVASRYKEHPSEEVNFKKFIIGLDGQMDNVAFYKSEISQRWWLELNSNMPKEKRVYIPCNQADYDLACNREIPDVWWKACQRYNIVK